MKKTAAHMIAFLFALSALLPVSNTTVRAAGADSLPESILVSKGIFPGHGAVAWGPEGRRLAYIEKKRLVIRDMGGQESIKSPVKGIYNIQWIDDSRILALRLHKKEAYASLLEGSGEMVQEVRLPVVADAAYPLRGFERLLLTRTDMEKTSIGIRTDSELGIMNTADGSYGKVFSAGRIHPRSLAGMDFIMGWSEAGPSPLDGSLILIDYKKPPVVNPYVRAIAVDHGTGEGRAFYRSPMNMFLPGAGWSPDGRNIAIPELDGSLIIIGRSGEIRVPESDIRGSYASWSPVSERICFGGYIISPDGGSPFKLMEGAGDARCYWSPGGRDVAVVMGSRLELIKGVDEPRAEDVQRVSETNGIFQKVRLLRDLLLEGLVERKDYDMRLQRLTGIETVEVSR